MFDVVEGRQIHRLLQEWEENMITGCLQKKNGYYYAVLYLKVDGKRKTKWVATKLPVSTTSERKAQKALDEIRLQYELQEEACE